MVHIISVLSLHFLHPIIFLLDTKETTALLYTPVTVTSAEV